MSQLRSRAPPTSRTTAVHVTSSETIMLLTTISPVTARTAVNSSIHSGCV